MNQLDPFAAVSTGSKNLDDLIGERMSKPGISQCPGFPRGRITQLWGSADSLEFMLNRIEGTVLRVSPKAPLSMMCSGEVDVIALDLSKETTIEDSRWWAARLPVLKSVLKKSEIAVVGYSPEKVNWVAWKFMPSLRMEVTTTERGIRYRVVKNMMGASQGRTVEEVFE